jgi:hypothetical protein
MPVDVRAQLDALVALLEDIARDRGALAELSPEERTRLIQAAGRVYNPDAAARRHLVKAIEKRRKADRHSRAPPAAGFHDTQRIPAARLRVV